MSSDAVLQDFARAMRAAPTDAEAVLWFHLRANRFSGFKFKRQQPIGNYIVDFVCLGARLIVEVDGGQHNQSASDLERDDWLRSQGFSVLRFWNNEVLQNLEGVLAKILEALPPSPQPLPRPGGGAKRRSLSSAPEKSTGLSTKTTENRLASLPPRGGGIEGEGERS